MYFRRKTADYFRSNFSSIQTLILRFGYLWLKQREFRPMAEVPFRPVRQLSEYKGKGASASRETVCYCQLNLTSDSLLSD